MFAIDHLELARILDPLHMHCLKTGLSLATAESCTGGLISSILTSKSGSSLYFLGGVCSYSNELKSSMLGVPEALIARVGAVSAEVANAMAHGIRERTGAALTVSVTGIAGPGGGSAEKPVGTVYCAWSSARGTESTRLQLQGDRDSIRAQTCLIALAGILERSRELSPLA